MKKTLYFLIAAIVAFSALCVSGCYRADPDTMDKLVGTYELTTFTRQYEGEETEHDYIKEKGIQAYLIVRSDGYGYIAYKDDETAAYAESVLITYTYETETRETGEKDENGNAVTEEVKTDNITTIRYDRYEGTGGGYPDGYPGYRFESLGFNSKEGTLHKYYSPYHGLLININHSQSVSYKKLNGGTDLSFVENKMNAKLSPLPYAEKYLNGTFACYDWLDGSGKAVVEIDVPNGTGKIYTLGEDGEIKVVSGAYSFAATENGAGEITIGNYKFYVYSTPARSFTAKRTDESGYETEDWYYKEEGEFSIEEFFFPTEAE